MAKSGIMGQRTELAANIWETVGRSWLLGIVGLPVLLLYLLALFIQQMPGQLRDDPAGAARWILVTGEAYGPWGGTLRALGLFNVLHNPLLQILLAVIMLVLLVQLGNTIATAWQLYQFDNGLAHIPDVEDEQIDTVAGAPVSLATPQTLYRLRLAVAREPEKLPEALSAYLADRFDKVHSITHAVIAYSSTTGPSTTGPSTTGPSTTRPSTTGRTEEQQNSPTPQNEQTDTQQEHVTEEQILALRHVRQALLRPLLFIGLFVALVAIWLILVWGWEVTPPPLAPGAEYSANPHGLLIQYGVEMQTGGVQDAGAQDAGVPGLVARVGEEEITSAIGAGVRMNRGQTHVISRPGPPALFMRTLTKAALLSRLGQRQMVPSMGLVFPSPGSEESVVINQTLGLRIVRLAGNEPIQPEQFLIEIYDVNANEVVNRIPVQQATTTELWVGGMPVIIEFFPLPSLLVKVTHQPGIWLLWPALILVMIGLTGYTSTPAFALVQLAPWPANRTVLIVQSDVEHEIDSIERWLEEKDSAHE